MRKFFTAAICLAMLFVACDMSSDDNGGSGGVQAPIGDTGPGGGTIFFAQGGEKMEVSGELGLHNWINANTTAGNHRGGGFSDWRLPNSGELSLMYDNLHRRGAGGFSDAMYWGGRVTPGGNTSHFMDFSMGTVHSVGTSANHVNGVFVSTNTPLRVRAVRSFTDAGGGATGTTLTIVNNSQFEITHVQWGNFDFTSGSDPIIGPGRSVTINAQPGSAFIRFRPRLNPFNLRSAGVFVVREGEQETFTIHDNTAILREVGNVTGTLASVAEAVLQIGDTGPGGGTIFFAEGGSFREVSGFLGSSNWNDAVRNASNHDGGGFDDWRLPETLDLSLMYENLHSAGLGGFTDANYWGPRIGFVGGSNSYWFKNFGTGTMSGGSQGVLRRVRAVRTFSVN